MFAKSNYDAGNKVWSGPEHQPIFHPNASLGQIILDVLSKDPEKIGQISANNGVSLTNHEIKIRSIAVAKFYCKLGLKQGDVVGIIARNTEHLSPVVFGAFICGTPISSLDAKFSKIEIINMYNLTKPKIVFCDDDTYEIVKKSLTEIKLNIPIYTVRGRVDGVPYAADIFKDVKDDPFFICPKIKDGTKLPIAIVFSSGTTGVPKGVCISHALAAQGQSILFFQSSQDVTLCFSPLYWLSGLVILTSGTLVGATRIITDEPFSPELLLKLIEKYKVTLVLAPPSQMVLTLQCPDLKFRDISSMRMLACGGSHVPPLPAMELGKHLKAGHVSVVYGMSEVGILTNNYPSHKLGSVGQLCPGTNLKIVDDDGNSLGPEKTGEIYLKPYYPFIGYFGNPEATKNALTEDGWVRSGDVGYVDNEGWVFVVDRTKEMMKYKTFPVSPSEIEDVILELPEVSMVSVCGISDLIYTDLPAAAIVKNKNFDISEGKIVKHVELKMPDYNHLRGGVYFVDSLPMTVSGKVLRRKVKEIVTEMYEKCKNK